MCLLYLNLWQGKGKFHFFSDNLFHLLCSLANCDENATGTAHLLISFCLNHVIDIFHKVKPSTWWCFSLGGSSGKSLQNALPHVKNHLSFSGKSAVLRLLTAEGVQTLGRLVLKLVLLVHIHQSYPF